MTFNAEDVMTNPRLAKDGPILVYWGQEHEEFFRGRSPIDFGERPRRWLIDRLRRGRIWKMSIRIEPPTGVDLKEHGQDIARILGLPYGGDPRESDRATWLPGTCMSRTAAGALGSAGQAVERLGKLPVAAIQIRIEEWT